MKKIMLWAYVSALLVSSCKENNEHEGHHLGILESTQVLEIDTVLEREYVCQIRSHQHIELRALEKGYLEKVHVDEGQLVRKNQLLFNIRPSIYQADMLKAQAELAAAQIEFRNTKSLADSNIVSKNELALSKARLDRAKAELMLAKTHLGFTEIRAPFDGMIGRFNDVRKGSLLDEGDLLTTLSDNSTLWVYFNVPEAEYLTYAMQRKKEGQLNVRILMANNVFFDKHGVVETIEADFNNETGNIAFRATFENNDRLLRHGETGKIVMTQRVQKALVVPQQATFEVLDKKYIFVVKNNRVQMREIKILAELPHLFLVADGLKKDEYVLLEGLRKVKHGDKITTKKVKNLEIVRKLNRLTAQ